MASDLMGTAVSGLLAFQRNLATTGHNITNVNTEGYNRQSVELSARKPNVSGGGFIGTGVDIVTIERVYDQYLFDQVTARNSSYSQLSTLTTMAGRIDELMADDAAGLDPVIQEFFDSIQDVANNPTSIPARQVMLSNAETLANRFHALDQRLEDMRNTVNSQIQTVASEVTSLATSIAELNKNIVLEKGLAGGQPPNDLLDKRDVLINQLSELVSVNTVDAADGSINVFIGNGQSLVLGGVSNTVGVTRNQFDLSQYEVSFIGGGTNFSISEEINGGTLGGLLAFRDQVLSPTQNAMGQIAISLSDTINIQHQLGDDLNGNPGGLFFDPIIGTSPTVLASSNNNPASGTASVTINDTNLLHASDYQLSYDGVNFSLLRMEDNTVVDSGFTLADFPRAVATEGITLNFAGGAAAGDSFLIRPVRDAAGDIGVALTDAFLFAAASTGNALGDNSNALALVSMQNQKLMGNGNESYQSAYSKLVAKVGVDTSEARVNAGAQRALLSRAVEAQQGLSGVNLDEEAANLVKFQQAYQAAAQVIRVADDIFQTLLGATGR